MDDCTRSNAMEGRERRYEADVDTDEGNKEVASTTVNAPLQDSTAQRSMREARSEIE